MSMNHLNQFPFEHGSINLNSIQLTVLIVALVDFILLLLFRDRKKIHNFFSGLQLFGSNGSQPEMKKNDFQLSAKQEEKAGQSVCRGETEVVLRSLGLISNCEETKLPARLDADDIFNLFEEKNPSLDEVKEAFDVFDSNRDGFIDAKELQKVLRALGLKEERDNCMRMISVFDESNDGRIDFNEFVKLMEANSC